MAYRSAAHRKWTTRLPWLITIVMVFGSGTTVAVLLLSSSTESPRPTVSSASRQPSESATGSETIWETCEQFIGDGGPTSLLVRIPDSLLAIGPGLSASTAADLIAVNDELALIITSGPPEVASHLRATQLPFRQVADAVEGGGGQLTIDTGVATDGVVGIIDACSSAGYHVN